MSAVRASRATAAREVLVRELLGEAIGTLIEALAAWRLEVALLPLVLCLLVGVHEVAAAAIVAIAVLISTLGVMIISATAIAASPAIIIATATVIAIVVLLRSVVRIVMPTSMTSALSASLIAIVVLPICLRRWRYVSWESWWWRRCKALLSG